MALPDFIAAIENAPLLEAFRESLFVFPVVEGIHLLGLSVAVGLLALVDLRLAGWFLAKEPVDDVIRDFRPWFAGGFLAVLATGVLLFLAKATLFYASPLFWIKMFLILLAGLNAVYFESQYRRQLQGVTALNGTQLLSGRASGLISLAFWIAIIVLGRLLAYYQASGAA